MSRFAGKPLNTQKSIEDFLQFTLDFIDFVDLKNLVSGIVTSELGVINIANKTPTLSSEENRTFEYRDEIKRWKLRKEIINELVSKERLSKDDDIKLGEGGAFPLTQVQKEKQAFILIGPPASGKSGISEKIADDYGAVIIDSDFAKRKLPEFHEFSYGSSLVHDESSAITYGFKKGFNPSNLQSLFEISLNKRHNLIIPTIGNNYTGILKLAKSLKHKNGYDVHLVLVALSKRKATIRSALRFYETGRYVPLSLIFDVWGNDSWLTYFYLKCKHKNKFKSFGAVSTDVAKGAENIGFDIEGASPVSKFKFEDIEVEW